MKQLLVIWILLLTVYGYGQSKKELEEKRKRNASEIKYTNELINETKRSKKISYNKLLLLDSKIKQREQLINTLNDEISYLNNNIEVHQEIIIGLERDLQNLKNEYEKIIYYAYLNKNKFDVLMFLLASEDFNTAFKRIKYLQQYSKYRKQQVIKIKKTKDQIKNKIVELEILKANKRDRLLDKKIENENLLIEKNKRRSDISKLAKKEEELKLKLQKQYLINNRLKKEIERIIAEEARKAAERLKKTGKGYFQLTPEERELAAVFVKNKNILPWPTKRGVVTGHFGEHPHPIIKGVKVRNDGIDITTNEGEPVRAIYNGKVSRVFVIPGANKTVIIRHGNYLSVYSNLKDVTVKQGDELKTKEIIGVVYTENGTDHKTVLKFQIWKENEKLDPEGWLAKVKHG